MASTFAGVGKVFGDVFKEWVVIEAHDESRWRELIRESAELVG